MPLIEGNRAGEFLVSEGNRKISREAIVLASGQKYLAGTVLGKLTVGGNHTDYDNGAADGSEVAVCILYADVDATDEDKPGVAIARLAEVSNDLLVGSDADGLADLAANFIIPR